MAFIKLSVPKTHLEGGTLSFHTLPKGTGKKLHPYAYSASILSVLEERVYSLRPTLIPSFKLRTW